MIDVSVGHEPRASARKASRLLAQAVALLEPCGASIALDQCRLALAAAQHLAQDIASKQARASKVRTRSAPAMPRSWETLVRADGTLRHVTYMAPSGKRPEVIAVSFRVPGLPRLTTSFTLVGRDFHAVYEAAVRALAKHVGVDGDAELVKSMISAGGAFRARYGL
jgi:hypothetical protein